MKMTNEQMKDEFLEIVLAICPYEIPEEDREKVKELIWKEFKAAESKRIREDDNYGERSER